MRGAERKISDAQLAELRERRAQRETLRELGQRFGYSREGVRLLLVATGGDPIPPKTRIGRTFNHLTVISDAPRSKNGEPRVLCRCFCGEEKILNWFTLTGNTIQSCGCQSQHQKIETEARWLTYRGRTKPLQQWCRELGLKHVTVKARLRYGWTVEEALKTPVYGRYRKLNEWAVIGAMAEVLMGYNCGQVAKRRGVARGTIEGAWYGHTWRELFKEEGHE